MEKQIEDLQKKINEHEQRIQALEERVLVEKKPSDSITNGIEDVVSAFKNLNLSNYEFIYRVTGVDLFLSIIFIAKMELEVEGLAPSEISKICREKIRISKGIDRTTISNALREAKLLVDRINNPRGQGFAYIIMPAGEKRVKSLMGSS